MRKDDLVIRTQDKFPISATQYTPENPKANLVIAAGLGIPKHFYRHIAQFAAERGYLVTTFDYRGINQSQDNSFKGREHKFSHWGQRDLHAVFQHLTVSTQLPLTYLAHSAGGQILGMTAHCKDVVAANFIGSVIPDAKNYTKISDKIKLKFLWWVLLPTLSLFGDMVPASKFGLSTVDVPTGVVREWSEWGRSKRYLFNPKFKYDLSQYSTYTSPLRVMAVADDELATYESCFDLASEYPNAQLEQQIFQPSDYNIKKMGHFDYFRKSSLACWPELFDWFDQKLLSHQE